MNNIVSAFLLSWECSLPLEQSSGAASRHLLKVRGGNDGAVPKGFTSIRCSSVLLQSIREQIQHEAWLHVFVQTFKGLQTFTLLNRRLLSCVSLCSTAANKISWINVTGWVFCFSLYSALMMLPSSHTVEQPPRAIWGSAVWTDASTFEPLTFRPVDELLRLLSHRFWAGSGNITDRYLQGQKAPEVSRELCLLSSSSAPIYVSEYPESSSSSSSSIIIVVVTSFSFISSSSSPSSSVCNRDLHLTSSAAHSAVYHQKSSDGSVEVCVCVTLKSFSGFNLKETQYSQRISWLLLNDALTSSKRSCVPQVLIPVLKA